MLDVKHVPLSRVNSGGLPLDGSLDVDALISFEFTDISPCCPTNESQEHVRIANLKFSDLDEGQSVLGLSISLSRIDCR